MAELTDGPVAAVVDADDRRSDRYIALKGELDISNAESARAVVDDLLAGGTDPVVFDMTDLRFMDSSGIAVLVYAANQAQAVTLRNPSHIIRRTIEITGLSQTFSIEP